jgi:quinol monooxygenase YgiN
MDPVRPSVRHAANVARMAAGQESARVGRYVRMVAQPGCGPALADTLLQVAVGLREAPGCELYLINESADEPDTVWITEVWTDEAASDAALGGRLGEAGIGAVLDLLAGPPELVDLRPLGGAGLTPS